MASTDSAPARTRTSLTRPVRDALEFIRISALGATVLVATVGLLSTSGAARLETVIAVAGIGILFHVFAYVLNDVVDIDLDRTEPRRAEMPLVTGAVTPALALAVVAATIPAAAWLTFVAAPDPAHGPALAALAAAFLGLGVYDVVGKRTAWPPVTDLVQALGWAALVLTGAWVGGGPTPLTLVLAGYVLVFILFGNAVHGPLRDLPNDHLHGVVTTATLLGARVGPGGRRILTRRLLAYGWVMEVALILITAAALALQSASGAGFAVVAALTLGLRIVSVLLFAAASRKGAEVTEDAAFGPAAADSGLLAAGMLHLMVGFGIPIALIAPSAQPFLVVALIAVYLAPVLTHGWLAGAVRWGRARAGETLRASGRRAWDLVNLTRPHNCLAAGLAVALGAHLGGVGDLLGEPVLRAGLVAALIVAAANVANDREDVVEDRINYPFRAIAAGRVSVGVAGAFAALLAGAGVALALTFGLPAAAVAAVLAAASIAYSKGLKRVFLAGNLLVAALGAATILYGALVVGRPTPAVAIGAGFVFLSLLGSEVLLAVLDREGDAAAGRSTIGTRLSWQAGSRLVGALLAAVVAVALLPWVAGIAPPAFALASVAGIIVPEAIILARLLAAHGPPTVELVYPISKIAWFTGLIALAFLV